MIMEEDLDEREMNALRQKALSTLPPKRKERRARQDTEYDIDAVVTRERDREFSHRSSRPQYQPRVDPQKLHDQNRAAKEQGRTRKASSSRSSSHSLSRSRSYSSYSSTASSTSGSRSRSSSSVSHSSYSSYTRSSYSSSRRSFSTSPHSRRIRKKHLPLDRDSHGEPRLKPSSSNFSSSRHYPPSSQWHDDSYKLHSTRSPPRARKGYPHHSRHSSRDYHDYPPAKRRHTDYPEYHRGPPPGERRRLHSPPPPPPPPALQRKERIIRHMRRSPLHRSPPPHTSSRSLYSHRPPSPPSHYPPNRHSHRPYRRPYSPPPSAVHSRDARLRRDVISDHIRSRPSSRDMRSLCGPPIHVRDRPHHRSPDRRLLRPPPRRPSYSSISRNSLRTRQLDIGRRREVRPPIRSGVESGITRRNASMSDRDEPKRKDKELSAEKNEEDKTSTGDQGSSGPPSLTSPTTAQLLWDEEEIELENKKEEGTVEGREEGEVEELDYDESMEDLDLHPVGNIDEGGGGEARKLSTKQDERRGTVNWDDPEGDEVVDRASNIDDETLLDTETEEQTVATEIGGEEEASGDGEDKGDVHISSPIRVSPDRKKSRVKCSPRQKEQEKDETKLSVKERLYVSRNAIEEKKRRLGRHTDDTSSKLPRSLANRLGPSPGLHGRVGSGHKGSALAIAAEYKRRKQAGELSPREAARATRITKRINAPEYRPLKHRKPEEKSEENERELDKKIDSIKKRNKALEKRHKEIERDKQLYG